MHEMALTENVVDIVLRNATMAEAKEVTRVHLQIGELRDIVEKLMTDCFHYIARGTIAENAALEIERIPLIIQCRNCGEKKHLKLHTGDGRTTTCDKCGASNFHIIQGNEFLVDDIEII